MDGDESFEDLNYLEKRFVLLSFLSTELTQLQCKCVFMQENCHFIVETLQLATLLD